MIMKERKEVTCRFAVTDADGKDVERYVYDPAGNILEKTVGGRKTTCTYDAANQLVSSTDADGKTTKYQYDAAGRMVKEGARTYRYGYLDKVLSVTEGKTRYTYGYHVDGQLASATKCSAVKPKKGEKPPAPETEEFYWDGLALVRRGGTSYVNEPHPGGGAAVLSSKDGVLFNDILGTTLGVEGESGYTSTPLTAFGDAGGPQSPAADALFTGKPHVDGLGHAFLFRNYRAGLGKWLTADPLGYPDGWNQLAYGVNSPLDGFDFMGARWNTISFGVLKEFTASEGDGTIPVVVAPNPNGSNYDLLPPPQSLYEAVMDNIVNPAVVENEFARQLFELMAAQFGVDVSIDSEIASKMQSLGVDDYIVTERELLQNTYSLSTQSTGILFYSARYLWLVHVKYEVGE